MCVLHGVRGWGACGGGRKTSPTEKEGESERRVVLSQTSHTCIYKCKTQGVGYVVFAGLRVFAHTIHCYIVYRDYIYSSQPHGHCTWK